jgi:hypothetical protein
MTGTERPQRGKCEYYNEEFAVRVTKINRTAIFWVMTL